MTEQDERIEKVVLEIPGVKAEPGDDTEMLFEQLLAQALASEEIMYDGLVKATRLHSHPEWEPYDGPCPECGNTGLYETSLAHGSTEVLDDGGIQEYITQEVGQPVHIECGACGELLHHSQVIEA